MNQIDDLHTLLNVVLFKIPILPLRYFIPSSILSPFLPFNQIKEYS